MLVLTRKIGESLIIGDNIKVTVVGQKSGQVRLGIEAPEEISIKREELLLEPNVEKTEPMPTETLSERS